MNLISSIHITSEGWWGTFVIQTRLRQEDAWDSLTAEPSLLSELHPVQGETLPQSKTEWFLKTNS